MPNPRFLIVVLMLALAGCASSGRPPERPAPVIPESTWRRIDDDILAASREATRQTTNHARELMAEWMDLVHRRTDAEFIPWFSSYWTRQALTMRLAWYRLNAEGKRDEVVERLALHLQEQYRERVLEPVARELDPERIMEKTTKFHIWLLGELLRKIPQRYGVPQEQFDRRLKEIPAIALAPPDARSASLHQLLHTEPIDRLPAYVALVARIHTASAGAAEVRTASAGMTSVARRTSERLTSELTTSGVASALAAAAGRAAGMLISLGAAGFNSLAHGREQPRTEAQLRKTLNDAFDEEWRELLRDPDTGVLAGVHHMAGRIEESLAHRPVPSPRSSPPGASRPAGPDAPPRPPW
ncbi:hypothetical protein AvCA_03440 [Azotobacter vinelandii CA]|uniref:Lipoprotein n=2 Tax=Azotobacter vinelandii TaxID=354 RepID=C1DIA7_AZOVD|nr:hypothetical protein [Azotobacter vinelandii]ACO76604.1 conserved hypothetical protein [Azotobacter vinelandii DJ]AGK17340.1 hypothetical protein AvCA_03440 [Azotobacter vinelandii CA]AGK19232.1 hypothetical protein AvCA6_03440 [Azotobacter vinelandii CA6]SFX11928.1 hypothetical protein SAMN04244547_00458 [Azotobacter vinelandii]GLK58781.1 hypothetical protein GCM10017624_09380 [Azotobacter vinelandii]